jgi:hypothetical protein
VPDDPGEQRLPLRPADIEYPACALQPKPFPDFVQYCHLVDTYSSRHLSFQTDALKAFSGILSEISQGFADGFFFAIPELFFSRGLL